MCKTPKLIKTNAKANRQTHINREDYPLCLRSSSVPKSVQSRWTIGVTSSLVRRKSEGKAKEERNNNDGILGRNKKMKKNAENLNLFFEYYVFINIDS
jgi:hypothetical protein